MAVHLLKTLNEPQPGTNITKEANLRLNSLYVALIQNESGANLRLGRNHCRACNDCCQLGKFSEVATLRGLSLVTVCAALTLNQHLTGPIWQCRCSTDLMFVYCRACLCFAKTTGYRHCSFFGISVVTTGPRLRL